MLQSLEMGIRRAIAWPLCLIGVCLVAVGGEIIRVAAWIACIDLGEIAD